MLLQHLKQNQQRHKKESLQLKQTIALNTFNRILKNGRDFISNGYLIFFLSESYFAILALAWNLPRPRAFHAFSDEAAEQSRKITNYAPIAHRSALSLSCNQMA